MLKFGDKDTTYKNMSQECGNLTIDDFGKELCQFKNRFDLRYFLMNHYYI